MSQTTDAWTSLRDCFQSVTGFSPLLSIGAVTNKAVLIGSPGADLVTDWGGLTNSTSFEVQALASDFPTNPAKDTAATITSSADGTITALFVSIIRRDGIAYLTFTNATIADGETDYRVTSSGDSRVTSDGDTRALAA